MAPTAARPHFLLLLRLNKRFGQGSNKGMTGLQQPLLGLSPVCTTAFNDPVYKHVLSTANWVTLGALMCFLLFSACTFVLLLSV